MDRDRSASVDLRLHLILRRLLRAGLVLLGVLVVSAACWAGLQALGDSGAAEGVRGVATVTFVALVGDVLAMVGLLAFLELNRSEPSPPVSFTGDREAKGAGPDSQG